MIISYNIGTETHHVVDSLNLIDDGMEHTIWFKRDGAGGMLQIDNNMVQMNVGESK